MAVAAYSHKNSKGQTYYLHGKNVTLRGGRKQMIYYFGRQIKEGALEALPEGKSVIENKRTGLPLVKGSAKKK